MPGRQKQPVDLMLVKGKTHLTKAEIEKRKSQEIKAPADKIRAPSYLPNDLKKEFRKLAKDLVEIEIMSNLDIDALARFVMSRKLYNDLMNQILEKPGLMLDKDVVSAQDKLFKQCRASATDLGLTITSRCKLVVPKKEDDKPKSKWDKFA
jgi:P27 family predicted phage terminase small subunit